MEKRICKVCGVNEVGRFKYTCDACEAKFMAEVERMAPEMDEEESEVEDGREAGIVEVIHEALMADEELGIKMVSKYADTGVLTRDAGLVVRMMDGAEYQLTIVKSK